MGDSGQSVPKALLPVAGKAAITHIFEKFPKNTRFILAIGFKGHLLREYVQIAHPDLRVDFVNVDPYSGPNSGPGASLKACQNLLKEPFFVVCSDTLWDEEIPLDAQYSWVATAPISIKDSSNYCVVISDSSKVIDFQDKKVLPGQGECSAFIGLFFVHDVNEFFSALSLKKQICGEHQLSEGLMGLCEKGLLREHQVESWVDIGTSDKYSKANRSEEVDMSKIGEFIYIFNGQVIKFYENSKIVKDRVQRSRLANGLLPAIVSNTDHFYSYSYIPGETLYEVRDSSVTELLLNTLKDKLWSLDQLENFEIGSLCEDFYAKKTNERLSQFRKRYPISNSEKRMNGRNIPLVEELLRAFPWQTLNTGRPAFIHGDLQFGNVIYEKEKSEFQFIDWRQDFGGSLEVGDLYYDLAKLYSGWLVDLKAVQRGQYDFSQSKDEIDVRMPQIHDFSEHKRKLLKFSNEHGLSFEKIELIAALILINIAPLYLSDLSKALFAQGQIHLNEFLSEA